VISDIGSKKPIDDMCLILKFR